MQNSQVPLEIYHKVHSIYPLTVNNACQHRIYNTIQDMEILPVEFQRCNNERRRTFWVVVNNCFADIIFV
mgnify:CR=1 FL=1